MALTEAESNRLAQLEAKYGGQSNLRVPAQANNLTSQESVRLAELESKYGKSSAPEQDEGFLSSIGSGIVDGAVATGNFIDSFSGAPTRSAIGAAMNGQNPLTAFAGQFGDDPSLAPSGKELAQNTGLSSQSMGNIQGQISIGQEQIARQGKYGANYGQQSKGIELPSPAGAVGLGVDVLADPLNFIPVGLIARGAAKGAKAATVGGSKLALKGSIAAIDAATNAATGSRIVSESAEAASNYLGRVLESTKNRWNPKRADDFNDFASIAKKNGINPDLLPETVEFGTHSTITKKSKNLAEGPGGEAIQKRYEEASSAIEGALDNQVAKFSGGVKYSDADAGRKAVESYNNGIRDFFDQDMLTHNKVIASNPGMILNQQALANVNSKIKGLKNKATGLSRRGTAAQRADAKAFLEGDLDILERSLDKNGNLSYKRSAELLTNIGNEAFAKYPPGAKIPPEIAAKKDLYFSLRDAMYESSAHVLGPEAAQELVTNNVIISDFLKEKGRISKIFEGDLSPDKLFKRIAESGDTNQLEALRTIMKPEDFNAFRGAYLDKNIVRSSIDKSPQYRRTMNNLNKKGSAIDVLFTKDEISEITDVLRLGDRAGTFVGNPSGTNTQFSFNPGKWIDGILAGAADEVTLEKLKGTARGKANAINTQFTKVTPKTEAKKIPLFTGTRTQATEAARLSAIQDNNKEIEKRKRAISGSKP